MIFSYLKRCISRAMHKTADFRPHTILGIATPIPVVGGMQNLQQLLQ